VSNPLDRYERFQLVFTIVLLSCSPDATGNHNHGCWSGGAADLLQRLGLWIPGSLGKSVKPTCQRPGMTQRGNL
jgi:hypothetical protein